MKRFTLYLLIMVLLLGAPLAARGQEQGQAAPEGPTVQEQEAEDTGDEAAEIVPVHYELPPEASTWLGGKFVHLDGSTRAMEYGWPHSSVAGGLKLHYSPLPQRFDAELIWMDKFDYNADLTYAYKDVLKVSYTGFGLWHNLDHFAPQPTVKDANPDDQYHVSINDDRVYLRLKWPERAYHVFEDFRQFEKEGTVEDRYYNGSKNSRSRDIDWITRRYTSGINGHFGPVELEYSHMTKTFAPHEDVSTTATISGRSRVRSVIPGFDTNSDTIKVHSDLTGCIVASATLTAGEKQNNNSGSEVDFNRAFWDLTLIPFEHVTVAMRYRYKDTQERVPSQINDVTGLGLVSTTDPIDSHTNTAGVTVRYAPINQLGVKAEYEFKNVDRKNAELWSDEDILPFQGIPSEQNNHKVKLGVNARPIKTLSVKGSASYDYTDNPAYSSDPRNDYKGMLDADLELSRDIDAGAYYRVDRGENDAGQMHLSKDNVGVLVTWVPTGRLSFYANYDYSRYRNKREIELLAGSAASGSTASTEAAFPPDVVPYTDSSHLYTIGTNYTFSFPLTLGADFHQSWSRGLFRTTDGTVVDSITIDGVGDVTDLRLRETGGGVNARYEFPKGWGATFTYYINNFEDLRDNPQDGSQDGTAQTVMVMLSKKW